MTVHNVNPSLIGFTFTLIRTLHGRLIYLLLPFFFFTKHGSQQVAYPAQHLIGREQWD